MQHIHEVEERIPQDELEDGATELGKDIEEAAEARQVRAAIALELICCTSRARSRSTVVNPGR